MKMKMKKRSHRYDINRPTILDKIFGTKWRNPVELHKARKVSYLIFRIFLTVTAKV